MSTKWKWRLAGSCAAAALSFALVLGYVYKDWKDTRAAGVARLGAVVGRLDAEDPGWRSVDLCKARNLDLPRDSQNGAVRTITAVEKLPKEYTQWVKGRSDWERAEAKLAVRLDEEELCLRAGMLGECADALADARTVRTLPPGGHRLAFNGDNPLGTLLPLTQLMREAGWLLDLDAAVQAQTGRPDEAIESVQGILACGRALGDEPTLVSQIVRMAVAKDAVHAVERVLAWSEPTRGLAELQAALTAELSVPRLRYGFRGERAMLYDTMNCVDRRQIPIDGILKTNQNPPSRRLPFILYRKHIPAQQAMILEFYTEALAAERLTGAERRARFEAIQAGMPPLTEETELAHLLIPHFLNTVSREDQNRARLGCAIAALACERYRLGHGRWPESLDAIPKDILPAVPVDPITDKSLQYRRTTDGVVLSAMPPRWSKAEPNWSVPPDARSPIEFRLFDPAHRGRPAPAQPDDRP